MCWEVPLTSIVITVALLRVGDTENDASSRCVETQK
jgi:hypothetical protein